MSNTHQRSRRRRPDDSRAVEPAAAEPDKRDTVTLQWIAVGVAIVALLAAAIVFSDTGGGGHGAGVSPAPTSSA